MTESPVLELIKKIQGKELTGKELSSDDRSQVVACLSHTGLSQHAIAQLLNLGDRTITRDIAAIKANAAALVKDVTIDWVIGNLIRTAEMVKQKALQAQDFALVWKVETDLVAKLQDLGCVKRVPAKLQVSGPGGGPIPYTWLDPQTAVPESLEAIEVYHVGMS